MFRLNSFRQMWFPSSGRPPLKEVRHRWGDLREIAIAALLCLFPLSAWAAVPSITQAPAKRTVVQGSNHTFSVVAEGTPPLFFQWRHDDVDLPGQTNNSLSLSNVQSADAGLYAVVVTNDSGSVTSAPARLTVRPADAPRYPIPQGGWAYLFTGDSVSNALAGALDGTWNRQNSDDSWDGSGRGPGNGLPGGLSASNGILTVEDAISSGTGLTDNRRFYLTHDLGQELAVTNANSLLNDGVTLTFRARLTLASDPLTELTNAPNGWVNANDGKGMFGIRQSGGNGLLIGFSLNNAQEDSSATATFNFGQSGMHMNNLNGNVRSAAVDPGEGGSLNLFPFDPTLFHEFWITIQDNGANPGTHVVSIYADGSGTPAVFQITAGSGVDAPFSNYLALGLPSTGQRGGIDVDFFGYKPGAQPPALFNEMVGFTLVPTNQFLALGQSASFNVGVTGTPPYAFQWYRNGTAIAGATNRVHTTPPVTLADAGVPFFVVVSNECNVITSAPPALVILLQPPTVTAPPQSLVVNNGDSASFNVVASSPAQIQYQWQFAGASLPNETNTMLLLPIATPAQAGNYAVVVSNNGGSVTSAVATLTVRELDYGDAPAPAYPTLKAANGARHVILPGLFLGQFVDMELDGQPNGAATGDDTNGADDDDGVTFTTALRLGQVTEVEVVASANGRLDAWVDFNGDGSWAGADEQVFTSLVLVGGTNRLNFLVPGGASAANSYARFRFSTSGGLSFDGPAADGEVEDYAVTLNPVGDLAVSLMDAPDPVAVGSNLTYFIVVTNGGPSPAAEVILTNVLPSTVNFISSSASQGGCSTVGGLVHCAFGSIASGRSVTITMVVTPSFPGSLINTVGVSSSTFDGNPANNIAIATSTVLTAPQITGAPQSVTTTNGRTATFVVAATGSPNLFYQWRFNGLDLPGETGLVLVLANVQLANAGNYSVRISNAVGVVESAMVALTVLVPPAVTSPPQSRVELAGATAIFSVVATGTAPLGFQWFLNDTNAVAGATNATLTLTNLQPTQAGSYRVSISNSAGFVVSVPAALTILPMDLGDAPDPGYPTLLASNGARHRIVPGVALGARVDFEPDGQPNAAATGDDVASPDDEDGVTFLTPCWIGQVAELSIVATTNGVLNAWLDFNQNGSWADAGDQIFTNVALLAGVNVRRIAVPTNAIPGLSYARFRFATTTGLTFSGEAADGEVEDYRVSIDPAVELAVTLFQSPNAVAVGSNFIYTIHVTNAGPSMATAVSITNLLPPGVSMVSASAGQGGCVEAGGSVQCALGLLAPGSATSAAILVTVLADGPLTNRVQVGAAEADLLPANNEASAVRSALVHPFIVVPPQSRSVTNGGTAILSVSAEGTALRFQWQRDGVDLAGATNSNLVFTNAQPLDSGSFTVRLTNEVGAITSGPALLTVLVPATITVQPQSRTVVLGQSVNFSVTAMGSTPLDFQWQFDGADLAGATNASLVLANAQSMQGGIYRVLVANPLRAVMSDSVSLTVLSPPAITSMPRGRTNFAGSDALLAVTAGGTAPLRYQWRFNATQELPGQTNATLILTNVQSAQSGDYTVVITNAGGMATSLPARLEVFEVDFGDAPEALGYPTILIFNGARHRILPGVYLGAGVDFEPDGQPNGTATGDDLAGSDDEDGVSFNPQLRLGQSVTLTVIASTNGFLDAWIDFDANGLWSESGEQIFARRALAAGTNVLTFAVPAGAALTNSFARFRFSTTGGLAFDGWANDGEVEDYPVTIVPSYDLAVSIVDSPDPILPASNLTYTITVTNRGPSPAVGVVLTNRLPAGVTFLSSSTSQGSCGQANGIVGCALGLIPPHGRVTATIAVRTPGAGTLFTSAQVIGNGIEGNPADDRAVETTAVVAPPVVFRSAGLLTVNDATVAGPGQGMPYPSSITVAGLTGTLYKVVVTLSNLSHVFPDDLDVLLVAPGGQSVLLMSDAGGAVPLVDVTPTFDDDAPVGMPNSGFILSQRYRPSNYGSEPDLFPAPAPAGLPGTTLSSLRGVDPNGLWSLFVVDDAAGDAGLLKGWSLEVTTLDAIADLALAAIAVPGPIAVKSNLVYDITITNRGPGLATGVTVIDVLPAGAVFISATLAGGSCVHETNQVTCILGGLASAASAAMKVVVQADTAGLATNGVSVSALQADFSSSNNSALMVSAVWPVTDLALTQAGPPDPFLLGTDLIYMLRVTNRGPAMATAARLVDRLPAGIAFVSAIASGGACVNDAGLLTCDLGNLGMGTGIEIRVTLRPTSAGRVTNVVTVTSGGELETAPGDNTSTLVTTLNVAANLAVTLSGVSSPVAAGSNLTFTVTVTNLGPGEASGIMTQFPLPPSVGFIAANSSQGGCTNENGVVRCLPGPLAAGQGAIIQVVTLPALAGWLTNVAFVTAASLDADGSNDVGFLVTQVQQPPVIVSSPQDQLVLLGATASFAVVAEGTAGLRYQWQFNQTDLPGATNVLLLIPLVTTADAGSYRVRVSNAVGLAISAPASLRTNAPPRIAVADAGTDEDTVVVATLVLEDDETEAGGLVLSGVSLNTNLVNDAGIRFGGAGSNRTVTLTPLPDAFGTAPIAITGWDANGGSKTALLLLTVHPVNDPPTLAALTNVAVEIDSGARVVALTGIGPGGMQETQALSLTVVSSAPQIVPDPVLNYASPGATGTLTFAPRPGTNGTALITVTVRDEGTSNNVSSRSFNVFVRPANFPPEISGLADQTIAEDTALQVAFVISDVENPPAALALAAVSSDPGLVPATNLVLGGFGTNRTLIITPATNRSGVATITLFATDTNEAVTSASFVLTVTPVNDAPGLDPIGAVILSEDSGPFPVSVTGIHSGAADESQTLTLSAFSSDPARVPHPVVNYASPETSGTLVLTPSPNASGPVLITVMLSDNAPSNHTVLRTFPVTDTPVNDPPTISPVADLTTSEGKPVNAAFQVADAESAAGLLGLSARSSNTNLLPDANIQLGGAEDVRTVQLRPALQRFGSATVTLTATDPNGGSTNRTFLLTVNPVTDPPTISGITEQAILEDTASGVIGVTVGGPDSNPADLVLTGDSSNPALLPVANIGFGGNGAARTLTLLPATNQFGSALVTLTVSDTNGLAASSRFLLVVNAVNDPPTLGALTNRTVPRNSGSLTIPLLGIGSGAANEAQLLTMTATSSNPSVVPVASLIYLAPQATGSLALAVAPNAVGSALITLTVDDGQTTNRSTSRSFIVTVEGSDLPPLISDLPDRSINEDSPASLAFTIGDDTTAAGALTLSATSSNPGLVSAAGLSFGGDASNRVLTMMPATNASGTTTITVTVRDTNGATASDAFLLTVNPVNDPPVISDTTNRTVTEDAAGLTLSVTVGDVETAAANLSLAAFSSNPGLVPAGSIVLGGSGSNRTVTVTPAPNQAGAATITLTVRDADGLAALDSFVLTVSPVNDAPTLSPIPDQTTDEDTPLAVAFVVRDLETAGGSEVLSGSSSDPGLVPGGSISIGGSGSSRALLLNPATNRSGVATITLLADDGNGGTATNRFQVTVNPVNDPPTLDAPGDVVLGQNAGLQTVTLTGIGSGAADEIEGLTISASSGDPGLIPSVAVNYASPSPTGTLTFTPRAGAVGTCQVTVTVNDGGTSNQFTARTFAVLISGSNTPPFISDIANQGINEDGDLTATLVVNDRETAPFALAVSAVSTNSTLVPAANIFFDGSGTNRILRISPEPNQFGTTLITLTVDDGTFAATDSFLLTVNPVNDLPTLDPLADLALTGNPGNLSVPLSGISAGAPNENQGLTVTVATDNPGLFFSQPGISYTSPDPTGSLTFRPNQQSSGSALITITVRDNGTSNNVITRTMTVYMRPDGSSPPTLSTPANLAIEENTVAGPLVVTLTDADTPLTSLALKGQSSNTNLVPDANIVLGGSGGSRTVTVTPAPQQSGSTTITLSVTDGSAGLAKSSFVLTVNAVNDPPVLSAIADQAINKDGATPVLPFTVSDNETPAASLTVTAASTNTALVPVTAIRLGGSGTNRAVLIIPASHQSGVTRITLTVADGAGALASRSFLVTVSGGNDPPLISPVAQQSIAEDGATPLVPFTISDDQTPAGSLGLTVASSNPSLVPVGNIVLGGAGNNRNIGITPVRDLSGTSLITLTVIDDAGLRASNSFLVTVTAVNDAPTLNALTNLSVLQGAGPVAVNLSGITAGSGAENQVLALTASSSNPNLVPDPMVTYASPGTAGSLLLIPNALTNGTATITVTVSDGQAQNGSASRSFTVTVPGVPAISDLPDRVTDEEVPVVIGFTISDAETLPAGLTLSAASSDTNLVAVSRIAISGTGNDRILTVTPSSNQVGHVTITITVRDASGNAASDSFELVVNPINDPPTINPLVDLTLPENAPGQVLSLAGLSGGPANEIQPITIQASSSNPGLIPPPLVTYASPALTGSLALAPVAHSNGVAIITVVVSDGQTLNGSVTQSFRVTVTATNDPPVLAVIPNQVTDEDVPLVVGYVVSDADNPESGLTRSANSSNPALVPPQNIRFGGGVGNFSLLVEPVRNQSGTTTITLTLTDAGGASASGSFLLTVNPVNDSPILGTLFDQATDEDMPRTMALLVDDAESPPATLTLSATSSAPLLIPAEGISFGGSGSNRTMTLTPASHRSGSSWITVSVADGNGAASSNRFLFTVRPVEQAPAISDLPDAGTEANQPTAPVAFTVSDRETAADNLFVAVNSSDPSLVPPANVLLGGSGSNRTLTITPALNQSGAVTLTVTVTDGSGASASDAFVLTVRALGGPPVIVRQPQDRTAAEGGSVFFEVLAAGGGPLRYQWQRGGVDWPGETNAILTLPNVRGTNAGSYRVRVSNDLGMIFSSPATLQVVAGSFSITIARTEAGTGLSFPTAAGFLYTVEYRDSLNVGAWTILGSVPGTGQVGTVNDPGLLSATRFYRIRSE